MGITAVSFILVSMDSFWKKLQARWQVTGRQLLAILLVFAITGTTTAFLTRSAAAWFGFNRAQPAYWLVKAVILIFGYQVLILLISVPFGQFRFFWNYEKRLLGRLLPFPGLGRSWVRSKSVDLPPMISIAVFASGAGSNARRIIQHFKGHPTVEVALIVTNKPEAGVVKVAESASVPVLVIEKERFFRGDAYIPELAAHEIDFIVLAGFLWKVPGPLVEAYRNRMVNIHPALLPAYGGKGMYGNRVHEAVIAAGEPESGISIHFVDEVFDHGKVIFQVSCPVLPGDNADSLASRIHELEHAHYPKVIEELLVPNHR